MYLVWVCERSSTKQKRGTKLYLGSFVLRWDVLGMSLACVWLQFWFPGPLKAHPVTDRLTELALTGLLIRQLWGLPRLVGTRPY